MLSSLPMSATRRGVPVTIAALIALLATVDTGVATGAAENDDLRRLEGRAVCLEKVDEGSLEQGSLAEVCNEHGARYAFHTAGGEVFTFLEEDPRAEMFIDPRIREQPLMIEGWLREGGHIELLEVFSIKDDVLHHIHYRCDICDITATAPGPCWCCGQEFELRERPVEAPGGAGR